MEALISQKMNRKLGNMCLTKMVVNVLNMKSDLKIVSTATWPAGLVT